ncbi:hypothetical protein T4E_11275 [Trichinella pseudospiralis]|uniref:Uncharacterized protein n=1 Tax=Trichinella pseudospiralis TaxID=6337 RepID=A0A0V0YDY8_TRIPS|nr:hypothetical protein T4E_11275 [Trichinella pseudospiralis]
MFSLQQQTNCSVSVFAGWRECMDGICFIEEKKKKKKKKKKKNKAETNSCWSVIIARLLLTGLISFVPLSTTQQ